MSKSLFHTFSAVASVALLSMTLAAQATYTWSPPNSGTIAGGSNNTIPFWSQSATYQQVHDAVTMPAVLTIKGLGMRPAGNRTVTGRSWDMRIVMSQTKVSAFTSTTTFSNNLGSTNTTIVAGTASTWQTFSWPNFTTNGFTPAFTIPFSTSPWTYIQATGNLCWEWRHKNGSIVTTMPMDASSAVNDKGTTLASSGTGCTATGKSGAATATMSAVRTQTPAYQHHLEIALNNGANNAGAMMAIALSPTTSNIGWCAPVVTPLLLAPGTTDSSGNWTFQAPLQQLAGTQSFSFYTQFGFSDAGQPGGIGLTDVAGYTTPKVPGANGISRIYKSSYGSTTNGEELATSGSMTQGYGLSIAWLN